MEKRILVAVAAAATAAAALTVSQTERGRELGPIRREAAGPAVAPTKEGLPAGHSPSNEAGSSPVPRKTDVSVDDVEAYFAGATANPEASGLVSSWLEAVRIEVGVHFSQEVSCRGWICFVRCGFTSARDAQKLGSFGAPKGSEVAYHVVRDDGVTFVNAYVTLPGATFERALSQVREEGMVAARAHASRMEVEQLLGRDSIP